MDTWIILDGVNLAATVHTEKECGEFIANNGYQIARKNHFVAGNRYSVSLYHVFKPEPEAAKTPDPEPVPVPTAPVPTAPPMQTQSVEVQQPDRNAKVDAVLNTLGELLRG